MLDVSVTVGQLKDQRVDVVDVSVTVRCLKDQSVDVVDVSVTVGCLKDQRVDVVDVSVTVGRLKDQRVDVLERLQLAKELWQTTGAVGPNKHQVVIDTLISILVNDKKRFVQNGR